MARTTGFECVRMTLVGILIVLRSLLIPKVFEDLRLVANARACVVRHVDMVLERAEMIAEVAQRPRVSWVCVGQLGARWGTDQMGATTRYRVRGVA